MPSPTTAQDIIEGALGLTNAVGTDQTLTGQEVADSLAVFNDLLEDWTTQSLAVWSTINQTFATVVGQSVYTIGATGNWVTARPVAINGMYMDLSGLSYIISEMTQTEYNSIALKTINQPIIQRYLYVNEFPNGVITFWPVPTQIVNVTISMGLTMTQPASAGTVISYPVGYAKALKYNLAVELASLFGKQPPPSVVATALKSLGNIKRANARDNVMAFDSALTGGNFVQQQRFPSSAP